MRGRVTLGASLVELRLQRVSLHLHQHLASANKIAFVDRDFLYPPGEFGGDINIGRLDPAVAVGETYVLRMELLPNVQSAPTASAIIARIMSRRDHFFRFAFAGSLGRFCGVESPDGFCDGAPSGI